MSDNTELKRAAEGAVNAGDHWGRRDSFERQLAKLATPEAVLALIAENEHLATQVRLAGISSEVTVHQEVGRAITETLAVTIERDQLKAENERQAAQFKEWQASHHANYCKVAEERDELRAEIAGLKTGYEAYEQVNAELKAENEELRANSSLVVLLPELDSVLEDLEIHGQHSDQGYRKLKDWYRKVDLACKAIDAAMGKGEQS